MPQPSRSRVDATGRRCSGGEASGESREAGEAGGAQAAFGRFWVAGRIGSWSVLVFGAKWIISGRQRVRCGRPACITNACLWLNLQLVHRFEDYRGTRIINLPPRHNRALTNILVHRLDGAEARAYYGTPYMGTDGRRNGANSPIDPWQHGHEGGTGRGDRRDFIAGLTPGSAHCTGKLRGSGWDSGQTKNERSGSRDRCACSRDRL